MTNHPNRNRTYWLLCPRGFANEYGVGIATSKASADQYEAEGYERISRDVALRKLTRRGDNATQVYASASIDGRDVCRFETARSLRG